MSFVVPRLAGAMIHGSYDGPATVRRLAPEDFHPVRAADGRALGCLWLSDFLDSTVGPYRELTVTFLVADAPVTVPWVNAWTPLAAQLRPDVRVCEYVLLLDNPAAIAYGRDLHGFDKHPGTLAIERGGGTFRFEVGQGSALAARGAFRERGLGALAGAVAGLARAHGVGPTLRELARRRHHLPVVTPKTVRALRSDLYFSGSARLQPWADGDALEYGDAPVGRLLAGLDFRPSAVQRVLDGAGEMPRLSPAPPIAS